MPLSVQQFLDDKFYGFLETGADQAQASVKQLARFLRSREGDYATFLALLNQARNTKQNTEARLVKTIMAGLEREDIQSLAAALAHIPEAVSHIVRTLLAAQAGLSTVDFMALADGLETIADLLAAMVKQLRNLCEIEKATALNDRLQEIANHVENLVDAGFRNANQVGLDPLNAVIRMDLAKTLDTLVARLSDTAESVMHIVLKHA
jgi:uncharacterized protein Yka (UPF0111/DUF47 family)